MIGSFSKILWGSSHGLFFLFARFCACPLPLMSCSAPIALHVTTVLLCACVLTVQYLCSISHPCSCCSSCSVPVLVLLLFCSSSAPVLFLFLLLFCSCSVPVLLLFCSSFCFCSAPVLLCSCSSLVLSWFCSCLYSCSAPLLLLVCSSERGYAIIAQGRGRHNSDT